MTPRTRNAAFATLATLLALNLVACAGPAKRVEIHSDPEGAEVLTAEGEKLGQTPLVLTDGALERATRDDRLLVVLEAPGHIPRQLVFDLHGEDLHKVPLTRFDPTYFSQRLLKDFHKNTNLLVRTLLKAQGLILGRSLAEAERTLHDFQESYPNVAASYALLANIEMLRGDAAKARAYLLRAEALDPEDPAILRALGMRVTEPSPGKTSGAKKASPKPPKSPAAGARK